MKCYSKAGRLPPDQKALLIWDMFRAQMTAKVMVLLDSLNIECSYVPANMTHFPHHLAYIIMLAVRAACTFLLCGCHTH